MGVHLIGMAWDADTLLAIWDSTFGILEVAIGLGLVIFVHELGHFSVAKLCGVKCEKFYLGFDIAGLRFWRHRWGETEYGIGILPLGGYVKMLGQEDNPAKLKEELDRAKLNATHDVADSTDTAKAEQALYDPRSFLAQSVPKRMAIISAGVIMNLIFAFVIAVVAYRIGVRQIAAGVGQIIPGEAAWQSNFQVGDRIVEIAGRKIRRFRDLQEAVSLGNVKEGIPFVVERSGQSAPITIIVTPDSSGLVPRIGISNPWSTTLSKAGSPVLPGSAAAEARPAFKPGDQIVKIDGKAIREYGQIQSCLAEHPDKKLQVTVEREMAPAIGQEPAKSEEFHIELLPQPKRRLGLEMTMGKICAIQKDSPATVVGLQPGDLIQAIDHQPVGDPLTLPERLRARAGKMIVLTVISKDAKEPRDVRVRLRPATTSHWA